MLTGCIPNVLAMTNKSTESVEETASNIDLKNNNYELGAVIVSLAFNAPSVERLLKDFEIESSSLLTPGSHTQNVYHVKFVEKTKEIVWEAIEALQKNSYVKCAEPNYYGEYLPIENPTTPSPEKNIIKGDADGDGKLTIGDVTYIQKYLVGLISGQEINCYAANVSENGKISIDDSTAIQKKIVGIYCDW